MKVVIFALFLVSVVNCDHFALLKDQIHEEITKEAAKAGGMKLTGDVIAADALEPDSLIHGVRWNDLPDNVVFKADTDSRVVIDNMGGLVWNLFVAPLPLRGMHPRRGAETPHEYNMETVALAQRSHYFDYQHFHSMTPCKLIDSFVSKPTNEFVNYRCKTLTNSDVLSLIASQASEWFLKGCINKVIEIDHDKKNPGSKFRKLPATNRRPMVNRFDFRSLWQKVKNSIKRLLRIQASNVQTGVATGVETGEFYLGNLLHMVEDSYSGAHCARAMGASGRLQEGPIIFFQDYSAQNSHKHEKSDAPECISQFREYAACAPLVTATLDNDAETDTSLSAAAKQCRAAALTKLNECYSTILGVNIPGIQNKRTLASFVKQKIYNTYKDWVRSNNDALLQDSALDLSEEKIHEFTASKTKSKTADWRAAPGAMMAALTGSRIVNMFQQAVKASTPDNVAQCESGARKLVYYLNDVAMELAAPNAVAGGSLPEYAGASCPNNVQRIIENIGDYTRWDTSKLTWLKNAFLNNILVQGARNLYKRLTNQFAERRPINSLELTCVVPCKKVANTARSSPACIWWNPLAGEFQLKCCIDIADKQKFNQEPNDGASSRSADAVYLRSCVNGAGTDEAGIIKTIFRRSPAAIRNIDFYYQKYYKKTLAQDLREDSSGAMATIYVNVASSRRSDTGAPVIDEAKRLYKAIAGLGTDKDTIAQIMSTCSPTRCRAIAEAYRNLPDNNGKETLLAALRGETLITQAYMIAFEALLQDYLPDTDDTDPPRDAPDNDDDDGQQQQQQRRQTMIDTTDATETPHERLEDDLSILQKDVAEMLEERKNRKQE